DRKSRDPPLDERMECLTAQSIQQSEDAGFGYVSGAEVTPRLYDVGTRREASQIRREIRTDHVGAEAVEHHEHDVALVHYRGRRRGRFQYWIAGETELGLHGDVGSRRCSKKKLLAERQNALEFGAVGRDALLACGEENEAARNG